MYFVIIWVTTFYMVSINTLPANDALVNHPKNLCKWGDDAPMSLFKKFARFSDVISS